MDKSLFYISEFYPLQDKVIRILTSKKTGFYLSGGTAASRGYLHHRFSDDLDFFVNDNDHYQLWVDRSIKALSLEKDWKLQITVRDDRFTRLNIIQPEFSLKIEFINDVPAYTGLVVDHPVLGRLDNPENILANKISALINREEPKDLADIWGFCCLLNLSINMAIRDAESKAAGIFPADLARLLCSTIKADWDVIRWQNQPPVEVFLHQIHALGESLLFPPNDSNS